MKLSTREESQTDLPGGEPERQVALSPRTTTGHRGTEHALSPRTREMAGGNAAVQRLATAPRPHPASLGLLSAGGGRALQRLSARTAQPKLTVSQPGDRFEVQADAVAARVGMGEAPAGPAPAVSLLAAPAAAAAAGRDEGPPGGLAALLTDPGPGSVVPADVRAQIEPHLGFDLGSVQVHTSDRAQAAAAQLQARAFTSGGHIFLGAGQSPSDLALMAHEATHVVQQQAVGVYRSPIQRESDSWLPDFVIDEVKDLAHDVPGYTMLTVVAGYDPIANENVDRSPPNLVRGVLGLVPFGNEIAKRLLDMGILQEAFRMLDEGLTAHNLTLVRIQREIDQVWDELSVSNGISGNIEVVERHVMGLYRDAMAFIRGIIDAVLQLIRDAAVGLASKLLEGRPVWDLTKKVLHQDPLTGARVDAPTVEILADFLTLIGKQDTLAQMQERGTLQKTADWLDQQLGRFGSLVGELTALFEAAWNAIQPANIAALPDNLGKLAGDAVALVQRVGAFAADIMVTVLRLVKESLLGWLSTKAHDMRGFRLLTVIIGTNPFTGEDVPRTAENLIGGFVALLPGGEETYRKLAEAGVIAEAGAQIEAAISTLGISPGMIVETFLGVWNSLSLQDLLNPIGAFLRVLEKFGEPLMRIISFVGEVIKVVIVLILKLMNFPSELLGAIISNAVAAIEDIKRDPVGFIINMLQALKTGLFAFLDKVLTYLLSGLADWLFRGLGAMGIQKPPDLTFASILTLVLQVLDITAEKLWSKLGKKIGDDVVAKIRAGVGMASDAFDFVKDVQENGVGAIWKHVESQLGNLWDTLLGMAQDWIVTEIVEKATAKLLSMLDPTGIMAVVNSTIAFFKAVQSVIDYIREILQIVNDYVSTLAAIAAGNIAAGAQKVEKGLADAVPVAIGFLANQAGLGNVPEKLVELIGKLRELVDKALDWLFDKAMQLGKAALSALGVGGEAPTGETGGAEGVKGKAQQEFLAKAEAGIEPPNVDAVLADILTRLRPEGLKTLQAVDRGKDTVIVATASPEEDLARLIPEDPHCRMDVKVTLKEDEEEATSGISTRFASRGRRDEPDGPLLDKEGNPTTDPSKVAMVDMPTPLDPTQVANAARVRGSKGLEPRLTSGGVIVPPAAGSREIKLVTWNTGEHLHDFDTNTSHAEPQFHSWVKDKTSTEWRSRVKEVAVVITLTPCQRCTDNMVSVAQLLLDAAAAGPGGSPVKPLLTINAATWYIGKGRNKDLSTTPESWAKVTALWTPQGQPAQPLTKVKAKKA